MMLEYATVSKHLADGMTLLLQTVGIVPSIRFRWMNKSTQLAYILRVSGYDQLVMLKNVFGERRHQQMQSILGGFKITLKQREFSIFGPYAAFTIFTFEYVPVCTTVHSL